MEESRDQEGPPLLPNSISDPLLLLHIQWQNNFSITIWSTASRRLPCQAKLVNTVFCTYSRAVWIKGTRANHKRQSSPSPFLPISSSFLWHVCYFHLGMWRASSFLTCAPLPGPLSHPGRCLTKGFLFIAFLSKLILIANTWGLFSRSPLLGAAGSVTPCHISPLWTSGLFSRAIGIRTDEALSRSQGDNLLSFLICITLFKI